MLEASELELWKKIHGVHKELLQFQKCPFFFFNTTAER